MGLRYSQRNLESVDLGDLVVPTRTLQARARLYAAACQSIETSPDKNIRLEALLKLNPRESLEQFCAIKGGQERLLKALEVACSDPYWRVRNYASSTLKLMTDLGLIEPKRMIAMIEAGTLFKAPRHTAFPDLDHDIRFVEDGIPLNREWTARANVRAAGLWAWAEASVLLTEHSTGKFGFRKLYPPGSSRSFPNDLVGQRDPFGIDGRQELPGLMRQYLAFSISNPGDYTRKRRYVETGIAKLVIGAPISDTPLDAGQLDQLFIVLAPKRGV